MSATPEVKALEVTVCEALTVYVPIPPVPETIPVMVVPAVTVDPDRTWPTAIAPLVTADTVRVVPAITPVNVGGTIVADNPSRDTVAVKYGMA